MVAPAPASLWLCAAGLLLPVSYCFLPLSTLPLQFLENRIPRGDINSPHIDGIIVLGGFTGDGMVAESRQTYGLSSSAERFTAALALAQDRPTLPIVFSGFSGKLIPDGWSEADQICDLVARFGGLGRTVLMKSKAATPMKMPLIAERFWPLPPVAAGFWLPRATCHALSAALPRPADGLISIRLIIKQRQPAPMDYGAWTASSACDTRTS